MAQKTIKYNNTEFSINYNILNNKSEDVIVFLHGWGSNQDIMKQAFSKQLKEYKHIYIDMPGFGKSENSSILYTFDYANIVKSFLESIDVKIDKTIIAGHSFGGKVATLLNPQYLVLLSTAGILETKSAKTLLTIRMAKIFNRFGLSKVTKMLRSQDVNHMSQNMYETFKNVVDEDFSEYFKNYDKKTLIFWGVYDTATTLESGKTINNLIKKSQFQSYEGDHYFFIKNSDDICDIIRKNIK